MKLKLINKSIRILRNPEREFANIDKETLESVTFDYLKLLVMISVVASIFDLLYIISRSVILDVFYNADVMYSRVINYAVGQSFGISLIYIFIGTVVLIALVWIIGLFNRKIKFKNLLMRAFYSLSPVLMFGWTPYFAFALMIWAIFLFIISIRTYKEKTVTKTSIEQRD